MSKGSATVESRMEVARGFEDEAVAAERAFAIRVAYDGIPEAFLSVLAEDSVICGEGPESGRPAYEALPKDYPGRLLWEPRAVAASPDGTLAFTAGPYRSLDVRGREKGRGVYFSVWRRNLDSGLLELVLDFGAKGAAFPGLDAGLKRLQVPEPAAGGEALKKWVETGQVPTLEGALRLGDPSSPLKPLGFFQSQDRSLGALWGARTRSDGSLGGFVILLGLSDPQPIPLACICA